VRDWQGFVVLSEQQLILRGTLDWFDGVGLAIHLEFAGDLEVFGVVLQRFEYLEGLHEVVAVLAVDHEELVEVHEALADHRPVRVPLLHEELNAVVHLVA
jgi:hypothetical protein